MRSTLPNRPAWYPPHRPRVVTHRLLYMLAASCDGHGALPASDCPGILDEPPLWREPGVVRRGREKLFVAACSRCGARLEIRALPEGGVREIVREYQPLTSKDQ